MGITNISPSTLAMGLRCGVQLRRRYYEEEIIPPGIALVRGTSVHRVNQVNLTTKLQTGRDEPLSLLKDVAEDTYKKGVSGGVYLPRGDMPSKKRLLETGLIETISMTSGYHASVAPELDPVAIERKFVIDAGFSKPLSGITDVETKDGRIRDIKTGSKLWEATRIQEEIQPVFYSFAHEHETGKRPDIRFHILVASTSEKKGLTVCKHQVQDYRATDDDLLALRAKIAAFIRMLEKEVFMPAPPGAWWCSERWCGYWPTCRYVGNWPDKKWV